MARIVFVNALFPPDVQGGAENYVLRTAKELQRRGHAIDVITTKPYDGLSSLRVEKGTYEGLETHRFFPPNTSHLSNGTGDSPVSKALWRAFDMTNVQSWRTVKSILSDLEPDVIHTNNLMGISPLAGRAAASFDCRHVHTLHDYSLICPKSNLLRDLTAPDGERVVCEDPPVPCRLHASGKRRTLGRPDVVTAPSQHVIDVHARHGFFGDVETRRLFLGVDPAPEHAGLPDERSVLFVGRQLEAKGLDTLLDAATRLPETTVHVCGTGPYAEHVEMRAAGIDSVRYHGYVSGEKLAQLRARTGAAVVPSIWMENSPLTIYESFAAGLPVIGSDIGGIPELVTDGERGYLFEPKDADELSARIDDVLSAPERAASMGENALAWAAEHTIADHVDRLTGVYDIGRGDRMSGSTA
jgi:glycosyltransferase involved in cell wall biosynthesis